MTSHQRKAFWRFDRDQTLDVSTESLAGREPEADRQSPVRNIKPNGSDDRPNGRANPDANVDQLRHSIDSGHQGDKVAFPDPAAAPLGTDDEAAGTPSTPKQVAASMANDARLSDRADASAGSNNRWRLGLAFAVIAVASVVGIAAVVLS